ncbi:prolipoprotein diacylglyceryl transferase [Sphingorhabdus arenilitoris]|uniref:Phosphatidylglycerol--prolipoprotein diacylglyceryl transferase n=1 Tax=Sphingorhabdus arenilitoris TaxID=1490041 RepID=A0ABV8RF43_9SPHN
MFLEFLAASANYINYTDLGIGPVALDLGFFKLRWYSLSYLVMILLGYWYLTKLIKRPGAPMSQAYADDLILYMTLGVILGGRFGYILFYDRSLLAIDKFYRVWEGGMSLHGGTLGVLFALWIFVRKHKLSYLRVCDYIAVCVPFGTFLVRLANFANGELWGRETDVPWAMRFPEVVQGATLLGPPRHPSQLYEAIFEGLLMAAILWPLFWKTDARYKPGFLFGLAALIYGTARFTIEYFRQPDQQLQWLVDATGFSMGQFLTMPMILLGLFLVATANKRRQRVEPVMGADSVA